MLSLAYFGIGSACTFTNIFLLTSRNSLRPLLIMFLFFISQYFGFSPAVQISSGFYPGTTPDPPREYEKSALMFICATVLFLSIGYFSEHKRDSQQKFFSSSTEIQENPTSIPKFEVLVILLAINMAYIAFVGAENFFTSFYELGLALESKFNTRIFIAIARSLGTLPLATCLALILSRVSMKDLSKPYRLCVYISFITLFVSCNPVSSYRVMVGMVWGSLILAKALKVSQNRFSNVFKLYIIALFYLFPLADYFRNTRRDFGNPISRESLTNGDFDSFAQLLNTFAFISEKGIGWGVHIVSLPLFWVPRSLWPEKPVDSAVLIANFRGYTFNNLSMPVMAELMLDFGVIGAGLVFLMLGMYLSRGDLSFVYSSKPMAQIQVSSLFLIPYSLMLFRGSLLQAVSPIAVVLVASKILTKKEFRT